MFYDFLTYPEKDEIVEDWCFIGEVEPCEWTPKELAEMKTKKSKPLRSINSLEKSRLFCAILNYLLFAHTFDVNKKRKGGCYCYETRTQKRAK